MKWMHAMIGSALLLLAGLCPAQEAADAEAAEQTTEQEVAEQEEKVNEDLVSFADFEEADELGIYERFKEGTYVSVVDEEGVDGSHAVKTRYEGYKHGSQRVAAMFELPRKMKEASLIFDVKFDKDFQFVRGGKLHGLGPKYPVTGGSKPLLGGWSARAMWGKTEGIYTYAYGHKNGALKVFGPDYRHEFEIPKERYYAVTIYCKINDPADQANGTIAIFVNQTCVSYKHDIQFRAEDGEHTLIQKFLFNTFHGGNDPSWAPKDANGDYTDVYAFFDNIAVYEGLYVRHTPGEDAIKR